MKNFKILGVTLSLFFILTDLFGYCVYAQSFEEDEDNDLAIIEEDDDYNTDDVNIENLLNSIRVNARCAIAMDSKTKQVLFEQKCRWNSANGKYNKNPYSLDCHNSRKFR